MKQLLKYAALCLAIGAVSGTAQANSQTLMVTSQAACFNNCAVVQVKSTRRIVRVQPIPSKKIQPSRAYNGKYLAKLTTKDQAYGKVLVPVNTTSRMPNIFRPSN